MYKERSYRRWVKNDGLVSFEVIEKETDLFISSQTDMADEARSAIRAYRKDIENYIEKYPDFHTSLDPVDVGDEASEIIKVMARSSKKAGVGPMAAIAGAIAEFVGRDLLRHSEDIIVENGGDIFLRTLKNRTMGIYAGEKSPFTGKLVLDIPPRERGMGICTSSGTVSHSLSFGNADAVLIISDDTALADAAATATGNIVKSEKDIEKGIALARSIEGVRGVLIVAAHRMGSWGDINLV